MISIFSCESYQTGTIEINSAIVTQVWILVFVHAAGCEDNLSLSFIHMNNFTNYPLPFGNLIFDFASQSIIQVEVIPSIPFG